MSHLLPSSILFFDQFLKFYIKLNFPLTLYGQPAIIDLGFFKLLFIENEGMAMRSLLSCSCSSVQCRHREEIEDKWNEMYVKIKNKRKITHQFQNRRSQTCNKVESRLEKRKQQKIRQKN